MQKTRFAYVPEVGLEERMRARDAKKPRVLYVPQHAGNLTTHPDCERGVFERYNSNQTGAFVRYGEYGATAKLTPLNALRWECESCGCDGRMTDPHLFGATVACDMCGGSGWVDEP